MKASRRRRESVVVRPLCARAHRPIVDATAQEGHRRLPGAKGMRTGAQTPKHLSLVFGRILTERTKNVTALPGCQRGARAAARRRSRSPDLLFAVSKVRRTSVWAGMNDNEGKSDKGSDCRVNTSPATVINKLLLQSFQQAACCRDVSRRGVNSTDWSSTCYHVQAGLAIMNEVPAALPWVG